jgi:exosortase/archaeosortase
MVGGRGVSAVRGAARDSPALPERIAVAVLALAYLACGVGWAVVALRNGTQLGSPLLQSAYSAGLVLSVFAPLLWFAAILLLARGPRSRLLGLVIGVVLLLPWPAWAAG